MRQTQDERVIKVDLNVKRSDSKDSKEKTYHIERIARAQETIVSITETNQRDIFN